jgi:hypothetical protein
MGNLAMYSFRTEDAIAEWQQAVTLNPKLEVEREDLAKAIELGRRKPEPVLSTTAAEKPVAPSGPVRRESAKAPAPSNPATSASAAALADSALLDSVSGSADSAAAVFRGAAFAAEKQPPSVRQAYIEVQLQSLLALSVSGKCDTLEDRIEGLSLLEDSQVPFIFHGFSEFMKTAHFQYYLGVAGSELRANETSAEVLVESRKNECGTLLAPILDIRCWPLRRSIRRRPKARSRTR